MASERKNGSPIPRALATLQTPSQKLRYKKQESFNSALRNRKLQIQRRKNIAACKILGMTNAQIGEIFNLRTDSVSTELRLADQEGILDRLNTDILNTLVPEAIKVYMDKLVNEKDAFVAKDVLKHLDRLTARADEKKKGDQPRYSIEAYIQAQAGNILGTDGTIDVKQVIQGQRAKQILEEARVSPHDEQSRLDILDGVVVE